MRNFDYSFLEHGELPAKFVNIVGSIIESREHTNERKRKKNLAKVFTDLENAAKFQSVKCSNMLDNINITDDRIDAIVNQNNAPIKGKKDELEIAGYRDALALVFNEYATLDICKKDILLIYKTLQNYAFGRGEYKNKGIKITDKGLLSKIEPVHDVMERLIRTYTEARNNNNINQLLIIPCFIVDFLCICPFEDANDRMAMLLSRLLLYKNGFDAVRYIPLEQQISRNQPIYNEALAKSSAGWANGAENDYIPFMEYFISMVLSCYTELDGYFPKANRENITKKQQIKDTVLNSEVPLSKSEICRILPDVSPTTVEATLRKLKKDEIIEMIGTGTKTKYKKVIKAIAENNNM